MKRTPFQNLPPTQPYKDFADMLKRTICPLCFIASAIFALPTHAQNGCEVGDGTFGCPDGQYLLMQPIVSGDDGGPGTCDIICDAMQNPPPTPSLNCVAEGSEYLCEVWPRSPSYVYEWTHDSQVTLALEGKTTKTVQIVSCGSFNGVAQIELAVRTPWLHQSVRVFPFSCGMSANTLPPPSQPGPKPVDPPEDADQ
jgi:hypothetical protein